MLVDGAALQELLSSVLSDTCFLKGCLLLVCKGVRTVFGRKFLEVIRCFKDTLFAFDLNEDVLVSIMKQ